jgi:hypothetical protein
MTEGVRMTTVAVTELLEGGAAAVVRVAELTIRSPVAGAAKEGRAAAARITTAAATPAMVVMRGFVALESGRDGTDPSRIALNRRRRRGRLPALMPAARSRMFRLSP